MFYTLRILLGWFHTFAYRKVFPKYRPNSL
jgi:hypothetical protein